MANGNDFFHRMCEEAIDELANSKKGWRKMDTNVLVMACFGILTNHLMHKLSKPLWLFAGSISTGVAVYIVRLLFFG